MSNVIIHNVDYTINIWSSYLTVFILGDIPTYLTTLIRTKNRYKNLNDIFLIKD